MDFNKLNHRIYISVFDKYSNNILPSLPIYIIHYLLDNPDKEELYLSPSISVMELLNHLVLKNKKEGSLKLMPEVIEYVEGLKCTNT